MTKQTSKDRHDIRAVSTDRRGQADHEVGESGIAAPFGGVVIPGNVEERTKMGV